MTTIALPDHLRRFPCMQPWIGSRYHDERHKRLLTIGESRYLPPPIRLSTTTRTAGTAAPRTT